VHGTQLGCAINRRSKNKTRNASTIRHIVTFEFKYRPLNVLRADGIIPAGPPGRRVTSRLLPQNSEVIDLTAEENNGLHSNRTTLRARSVKLELKRERSLTLDDQIIDLTV